MDSNIKEININDGDEEAKSQLLAKKASLSIIIMNKSNDAVMMLLCKNLQELIAS